MEIASMVYNFLTSAAVGAVITCIISYVINTEKNHCEYIQQVHNKWRNDIIEIIDELNMAKTAGQIRKLLLKIKVRLNPYGKNEKLFFWNTHHIWDLIQEMEDNIYDNQENNKEKLIAYLTFLVEYDYEKIQITIKGNSLNVVILGLSLIGIVYTGYQHFHVCKFPFDPIILEALILFVLLPIYIATIHPIQYWKNLHHMKPHFRDKMWDVIKCIGFYAVMICIACSLLLDVWIHYKISAEYLVSDQGQVETSFVITVMILLFLCSKWLNETSPTKRYMQAIKEIYNTK